MTTTATPAPPVAAAPEVATEQAPTVAPVRTRRSGAWMFASIAVILAGAVAGVFLYNFASSSTDVFVAAREIPRGATITESDLTTMSIAEGQQTAGVTVDEIDTLLGAVASTDIPEGGLVTTGGVNAALTVPDGRAVVGLSLTPAQMPVQQLRPGDQVMLVPAANQAGNAGAIDSSSAIPAVVSQVSRHADDATISTGQSVAVVDVYVSQESAPAVASQAAAGALALYLLPSDVSTGGTGDDAAGEQGDDEQ